MKTTRTLALAATALLGSAASASAAQVGYRGRGITLSTAYSETEGANAIWLSTKSHPQPRKVVGDLVPSNIAMSGKQVAVYPRLGTAVLHFPDSNVCPAGCYAVIDLDTAVSKVLPCEVVPAR